MTRLKILQWSAVMMRRSSIKTMMRVTMLMGAKLLISFPAHLFLSRTRLKKIRFQEDESLRKWKEKLLGCLESDLNGRVEPEVKFHSIGILSSDFGEINTPLPVCGDQSKPVLFTLKEGSEYRLKLTFSVLHNIVSGLAYTNTVWKGGVEVDRKNGMLGTFAPQREPYIHTLEEETTPSGVLARGNYTAKLRFEDDDRRCHMELDYVLEIRKSR
ncbi:rho GDP-dissociation inhibitor 1-like isoform X2 [Coffea eugenioides]|uniref:Rho GDP-dissociation inhibitor 1-like isoform X2 n=1 Tax=Coffea arabica TaxID=13443 RepID=A0A6P6UW05_COFAR|nr:rho GDP-dissociation inhibitor 1-like isoform X2 [Coffea arabica]XP_027162961.1 rho GDP-dissociation inhibitor 1-like isoform X2 [Coffea eugenioides]